MALCSHLGGSVYISCSDIIRCGFGSHLCASLRREEIRITNDKAFSAGTLTELAREDAIRKSNIVIFIISKEYPSSKDCLDELEMILKYGEEKEILSACYHIGLEDIRYQTGSFKNAFIELGSKFPEQMVKIWRNGFGEVAAKAKATYKVNIGSDESGIVQDITRDVRSMMKCVCSLDTQGLNDAILQPTTTHRTSSMPVSGGLSKEKQIADVKVGKLGPQAASCRTSLVPFVSVADAVSSTHLNMQKMLSCNNQTASTSSSFSDVNHDVDRQTFAKDSVLSQSCLKRIGLEEGRLILVGEVDGELVSGYETPIIESDKPLVPNRELSNDTAQTEDLFGLQEDLLIEIVKKLHAFHHFAFCSTVCKACKSACSNLKWSLDPPHPWSIHFQGQNIMNHLDDGRYVLERWEIDGRYYYGCVNGWILSIGSKHMSIFNLFSRTQRNLPILTRVGYLLITKPSDWYRYIDKFILFKVGQGDDFQFFAVALFGARGFIAFTRPSVFQDWICIESDDMACCSDVVLFRGRFYALCGRGKLFLCAFDRSNPCVSLVSQQPAGSFRADKYYLVKNVDHLIAVFQYRNWDSGVKRFGTKTFRIYRSDGSTRDWTGTDIREPIYLKGRALFISNGNSWTIGPAKVKSFRTNSIYFVDDYWFSNNRDGHFIGVFDIANGTIEDFQFEMDQYSPNDVSPFSLTDNVGA